MINGNDPNYKFIIKFFDEEELLEEIEEIQHKRDKFFQPFISLHELTEEEEKERKELDTRLNNCFEELKEIKRNNSINNN